MALPEDLIDRIRRRVEPIGFTTPSDLELIVRELQALKAEILKIKEALKRHGIEID